MSADLTLPLIMRWVHVLSAIVAMGGTIFLAFVFNPIAVKHVSGDEFKSLRHHLMRRWKLFFHPLILLFLISGFYNYLAVTRLEHDDQPLYHMLFGIKFLLALGFFALGIIATSTMGWSEKLREGKSMWWALVLVGVAIVLTAGVMKILPASG